MDHRGGKKTTCPECSQGGAPRSCMFFNKDTTLTKYAFKCGYMEVMRGKNLSMEHGTYHVKGQDASGARVWESFDTVKPARKYLCAK